MRNVASSLGIAVRTALSLPFAMTISKAGCDRASGELHRLAEACNACCVRNEAFYTTAAQVLPTLLIALAVELHLLWKQQKDSLLQARRERENSLLEAFRGPSADERLMVLVEVANVRWTEQEYRYERLYRAAQLAAYVFVVGEGAAFVVLGVGTAGWLPMVAGPITALSTACLGVLVVVTPFARLPSRPTSVGLLPSRRNLTRARARLIRSAREPQPPLRHPRLRRSQRSRATTIT